MQVGTPNLYRAVKAPLNLDFPRASTNRAPSNVPYLVDNIWEWLRPADMPSRRRSAYASPSPELAAEAAGLLREDVFLVNLSDGQSFAQLVKGDKPWDARHHADVSRIRKTVQKNILPKGWFDTSVAARGSLANLFLPCLERAEVEACLVGIDVEPLIEASSFWADVRPAELLDALHPTGEIFFEGGYALTAL